MSLAVFTKAGALLQNTALTTFLGTANGLSRPACGLRPDLGPLVARGDSTDSRPSLWFAYSQTGDPQGAWYIYHAGFPYPAGSIIDYPSVGMTRDAFIYTSNNFGPSSYINSTAFTVPKSLVYNGFGWGASLPGVPYNTTPTIMSGRPTQYSSRAYLLSPDDAANVMKVYYFINSEGDSTLKFRGDAPYNWAAPSRRVNQPGTATTLDPLDGRIGWAVSQLDNRLWFAHGADIVGFPTVNWGNVNPSNLTVNFDTAYMTGTSDDFNPSIAAMSDGTTTRQVLSWAYTDTPNNVATRTVYAVHNGIGTTQLGGLTFGPVGGSTSNTRFGDYSSVAPEYNSVGSCPSGSVALVTNQYFAPDGTWRTRLGRVRNTC